MPYLHLLTLLLHKCLLLSALEHLYLLLVFNQLCVFLHNVTKEHLAVEAFDLV